MSNDCNKSGMLGYDRIADCWSFIGSTAERGASGPIGPLMADHTRSSGLTISVHDISDKIVLRVYNGTHKPEILGFIHADYVLSSEGLSAAW